MMNGKKILTVLMFGTAIFSLFFAMGCEEETEENGPFILTNLQNEVYMEYYQDSFSTYYFPVLMISSEPLAGDLSMKLMDDNGHPLDIPVSVSPVETIEAPLDIRLTLGDFDWNKQLERHKHLQTLDQHDFEAINTISEIEEDSKTDALENYRDASENPLKSSYAYLIEGDLAPIGSNGVSLYTSLSIYSDEEKVYSKNITLKYHNVGSDLEASHISPRVGARMDFEIPQGIHTEFDFPLVYDVKEETRVTDFTVLGGIWEIDELYLRILHNQQLEEKLISKDELDSFELDLDENSLLTVVPRLTNPEAFATPFYYGAINFEIVSTDGGDYASVYTNSGPVSTYTDPYLYKSQIIDHIDYTDLFRYRHEVFPLYNREAYVGMES